LEPYSTEDFLKDMSRITQDKYDKQLGKVLVEESNEVVKWLAKNGLDFELSFNRQVSLATTDE
jgi:aspartate oxidase